MSKARDIAIIGVYIALLIGGQYALSFIAGVEIVTVIVVGFSYYFGLRRGLILTYAFSALRCFIFGFFPTVAILYPVYYTLLVSVSAGIGRAQRRKLTPAGLAIVTAAAALCTVCFTLLDDAITPLMFGFNAKAALAYFLASVPTMCIQTLCTIATVAVLFPILLRAQKACFDKHFAQKQI